jgi:hypothetical protein
VADLGGFGCLEMSRERGKQETALVKIDLYIKIEVICEVNCKDAQISRAI